MAVATEPAAVKSPTEEEFISALSEIFHTPDVKAVFEQPVVRKMLDLDVWGKEKGLDTDMRAELIRMISAFLVAAPDMEVGKEYAMRAVEIIAEMGPALVATIQETK